MNGLETEIYGGNRGTYFNLNPEIPAEPPQWLEFLLVEHPKNMKRSSTAFAKYQEVFLTKN